MPTEQPLTRIVRMTDAEADVLAVILRARANDTTNNRVAGVCERLLTRVVERTPDIVHVATIDHRHGTNLYARRTEAALIAQIAEYCRTDWPADLELPTDDAAAVDVYFEHIMDDGGEEWLRREEINLWES
mgnify:CR=1 FL=1